ncbi:sirohydrochlorin cobaltochelatase [Streptococcus suis]|uniref:Sirohydrochlorin cobaltochelatase n=1 Tax=Streptococcus suis TaxID=1307 RepID=A0A9X4MSM6_STRSU|nr:sirohydrochlorin cobaltochelatase [Streptococcus suis]MDG4526251.1 sirohydrochlorin cobaltochelatase [Streptococcus suis]MDG4528814.1 sirohydrochlorin cobaltochelatase [Streptococcus suis]HEM6393175.1 sirohydrochlorin cobaltochelatase [Streptococcus suis]HEM6435931.1 sirohydrochlorin cobaltochelatase [Streptococcus suis]
MTKAILLVSFGTTHPETRQKTIGACEQAIKEAFPQYAVYQAYTSTVVLRRIKENEGLEIPTVRQALEQMKDEGIREVYIQPLHIIAGGEFGKILNQSKEFQSYFDVIKVGQPLLHSERDYQQVKDILMEHYGQFGEKTATVLMGHGSQHNAFVAYAALDHMLVGSPVYLGCVESYPPVEQIEETLQSQGIEEVHLAPFMLVAGEHATNDMMSDDEDSWKTYFSQRGYKVTPHLIGLGEYAAIQDMYIQHLQEIID